MVNRGPGGETGTSFQVPATYSNLRFWRNVALISAVHLVAIYGLVRWTRAAKETSASSIVWLQGDPGLGGPAAAAAVSTPRPKPMKVATPLPEAAPVKKEEPEEDLPDGERKMLGIFPQDGHHLLQQKQ